MASETILINNQFQRGSEWRRWDLQIHTPFSYLNNGFGTDWDMYVQTLFKKAIENKISVIGITDYFIIDGYKKIKTEYLENLTKLKELFSDEEINSIQSILFLPNIEFRLNKLVGSNRINYHVIFSDKLQIKDIEENFLHDINFVFEGGPQTESEKRKLKMANLEALGQKLRQEHSQFQSKNNVEIGMMNAVVDDDEIIKILKNKRTIFEGKYIIALPCDEDLSKVSWNGQDHQARKVLIQQCDFFVSQNPSTIKWGLGETYSTKEDYVKEFKSIKPCISGSDAHNYGELFVKNKDRKFWIKGDTTFEGLRQILNEPERFYIGELPTILKRVDDYPTKYISKLELTKIENSRVEDIWFNNINIEFNHELVAIIGNKGKGKSALSDIIGLCGNSHNYEYFSFLNDKKFKKPQPLNLSNEFIAKLIWENGTVDEKKLNEIPNNAYEKVKYLPQNFLEALCTNIDKKVFEEELEKVIFSRLDDAEKIGRASLKEIINYRKEIIEASINHKKIELSKINLEIEEREQKNSDEYKNLIAVNIEQKNSELSAHENNKPLEKSAPEQNEEQTEKNENVNLQIKGLREEFAQLTLEQSQKITEKSQLVQENADLEKLEQTFTQLKQTIEQTINNNSAILQRFNIQVTDVIKYEIDVSKIQDPINTRKTLLQLTEALLSEENTSGFISKLKDIQNQIDKLQNELDTPNKEYQQYLTTLREWQSIYNEINGNSAKEGSLQYFIGIKKYIDEVIISELETKYQERNRITTEIIKKKNEIIEIYKSLYKPVTEFIDKNQNEISEYNVNMDVNLNLTSFPERFFNYISNGIAGSFVGSTDSRIMLNNITRIINFNDPDNIIVWLNNIVHHMHFDKRQGQNNIKRDLKKQLKGSYDEHDFYDFLFSLEYLEPNYELKLAEKSLSDLSPGERGALLLIFYLLLDKDDIPIVIDQPEENLDNQSVYKILVPFIKKAKKRRQIIIVTHNPNLAVVCDADQIIKTDIDKSNKNMFSVKAGSIENTIINAETIDVLEGTRPALNNRTSKYDIFKKDAT